MADRMETRARDQPRRPPDPQRSQYIDQPVHSQPAVKISHEHEHRDLPHNCLWEVVRVYFAGKLIPIKGSNDSGIDGTLLKGIMEATCKNR